MRAEFSVGPRPVFSFYCMDSTVERWRTARETPGQPLTAPSRADSVLKSFGHNPRFFAATESQFSGTRACQPTESALHHCDCDDCDASGGCAGFWMGVG